MPGSEDATLVKKIQELEETYRSRVFQLDNEYNKRIRKLAQVVAKTFRDVASDPLVATMKNDPVSSQFVAARVNEILHSSIFADREATNKDLMKRLASKESEVEKWKREYERLGEEVKTNRQEEDRNDSISKENEELREKLSKAKLKLQDFASLEEQVQDLNDQLASAELRGQRAAQGARLEMTNLLKDKSRELQRVSNDADDKIAQSRKEIEDHYKTKVQQLQHALRMREETLEDARRTMKSRLDQSQQMNEEFVQAQKSIQTLRNELDVSQRAHQVARDEQKHARMQRDRAAAMLQASERERMALRKKYVALGQRIETMLREEDFANAKAKEILEMKRQALKQELVSEKKARRHEHRVHKRAMRGLESANAELRMSMASLIKDFEICEAKVKDADIDAKKIKDLIRENSEKEALIVKLRSENDVQRSRFLADSAAAGRNAQAKVENLAKELEDEKRQIHKQYQALLTRKADQLQRVLGEREKRLEAELKAARKTIEEMAMNGGGIPQLSTRSSTLVLDRKEELERVATEARRAARKQFDVEIAEIHKGMEVLESSLQRERDDAGSARKKLAIAEKNVRRLEGQLKAGDAEIQKLKSNIKRNRSQEGLSRQEVVDHLQKAGKNLTMLKEALDKEKANSRKLQETVRAQSLAAAKALGLEQALVEKEQNAELMRTEVERLRNSMKDASSRLKELKKEHESEILSALSDLKQQLQSQKQESEEKFNCSVLEVASLKQQLEKQKLEFDSKLSSTSDENRRLQSRVDELSSQLDEAAAKTSQNQARSHSENRMQAERRGQETSTRDVPKGKSNTDALQLFNKRLQNNVLELTERLKRAVHDKECVARQSNARSMKLSQTIKNMAQRIRTLKSETVSFKDHSKQQLLQAEEVCRQVCIGVLKQAKINSSGLENRNAELERVLKLAQNGTLTGMTLTPASQQSTEKVAVARAEAEAFRKALLAARKQTQRLEDDLAQEKNRAIEAEKRASRMEKLQRDKEEKNEKQELEKKLQLVMKRCEAMEQSLIETEEDRSQAEADAHEMSRQMASMTKQITTLKADSKAIVDVVNRKVNLPLNCRNRLLQGSRNNNQKASNEMRSKLTFSSAISALGKAIDEAIRSSQTHDRKKTQSISKLQESVRSLKDDLKKSKQNEQRAKARIDAVVRDKSSAIKKAAGLEKELRKAQLKVKQVQSSGELTLSLEKLSLVEPHKRQVQDLRRQMKRMEKSHRKQIEDLQDSNSLKSPIAHEDEKDEVVVGSPHQNLGKVDTAMARSLGSALKGADQEPVQARNLVETKHRNPESDELPRVAQHSKPVNESDARKRGIEETMGGINLVQMTMWEISLEF